MKSLLRISVLMLSLSGSISLLGQCLTTAPTYKTKSNGTGVWTTASDWVTQPPYTLTSGAYTIPAGESVLIENNLTLHSSLIVNGILAISGQLNMDAGATIKVGSGGLVTCCTSGTWCSSTSSCVSCGSSDKIDIGSTHAWAGGGGSAVTTGPFSGPTTLSTSGLPITLISFDGTRNENSVHLTWATASEFNFDYFNLEKSSNGEDFYTIANVKGHGTTNERNDYEFEDNFPLIGKNYYRLTSVDFDNYRETFKVIEQDYSGEKNFEVSPNPSNGKIITLNFNFNSNGGQVVVYDNVGVVIDSFQVNTSEKVSFTNSLKDGIYFVKYSSPSFTKAIRFLVQQ
ncbi:MAG TPA: T9SS type A sorting domain-containing protein [Cyclobacteriaceae bacterium]|jgi:hypothetical protein|nr:T9SS type A sorting domain-containing protein [Cyclobacteriaceae bacterium]